MAWYSNMVDRLFGKVIDERVKAELAAVSIRIDDSPGWQSLDGTPIDRPWADRAADLEDALEAWRANFLVRRITNLIRSYVVGNGLRVSSHDPDIDRFVQAFWNHPQNRIDTRLGAMCDELTRAGELFPALFTNRVDGMSYVRFVPASRIYTIQTAPNDYETEITYTELDDGTGKPHEWNGTGHRRAFEPSPQRRIYPPLMLHFCVNRPIGATRGEGDLGPVLPWALRYSEWLKDRVRLNRQRTRAGVLDVKIADDTIVEQKREQLRRSNPVDAGIYVHGPGEEVEMHNLEIGAHEAKDDGLILRLAVAGGANVALHYLGEGEAVNYATAKEMGEPTSRFFSERQAELCRFCCDLVAAAYRRKAGLGLAGLPAGDGTSHDLRLYAAPTEVARADNLSLAQAANEITQALATMTALGLVDRETAARLAYKFAGERLTEEEVQAILRDAPPPSPLASGGDERGGAREGQNG